jgi:cyclophilin family peptidyl-prolyl cis-trans isomerase
MKGMNQYWLLGATAALMILATSCAVKPVVEFSTAPQKLTAPAKVTFENKTVKADTYAWDFGDEKSIQDTSTKVNPTHVYKRSGNYTVVLKATKGSKTVTRKQIIQVMAPERCLIEIETEYGTMLAELFSSTPQHRDNFVKLTDEGYYNDLLFHRVINTFMIQGGDPNSRNAPAGQALGFGGPTYKIPAEFVDSLVHTKGAIAAARDNNPQKASSGSQFYIVQGRPADEKMLTQIETMRSFRYTPEQRKAYMTEGGTPQLDREYTVFGRVIQGLDIIDKIAAVETERGDRPKKDVKMKITVIK